MDPKDFSVRVGQEEIGRIFNLKENLDLKDLLVSYAPRYQQMGWVLVGIKSAESTPLELDLRSASGTVGPATLRDGGGPGPDQYRHPHG